MYIVVPTVSNRIAYKEIVLNNYYNKLYILFNNNLYYPGSIIP